MFPKPVYAGDQAEQTRRAGEIEAAGSGARRLGVEVGSPALGHVEVGAGAGRWEPGRVGGGGRGGGRVRLRWRWGRRVVEGPRLGVAVGKAERDGGAAVQGVGAVALATLFEDDGEVDVKATADFAANWPAWGSGRWRWPGRPARRPPSPPGSGLPC